MNDGLIYLVDTADIHNAKEYLSNISEEELFKEFKRKCKDGLVLCNKCKKPIFDKKNSKTGLRFMSHYKNNSMDIKCDNFDTSVLNKYGARSNIYYGEGSIHEELNNFITNLLHSEPELDNIQSEAYIFSNSQKYKNGIRKRKKPDIQADYKNTKIAFEIQLSYQLHIDFFSREEFYREDGIFLMWFFYNLNKEDFKESDKMIFWNNNENAFVITDETKIISKEKNKLHFYCYYREVFYNEVTHSFDTNNCEKIITIDDLNYCHVRKELYYKNPKIDELKLKILISSDDGNKINFDDDIRENIKNIVKNYPQHDGKLIKILQVILSLKLNKIIGYKFTNFIELLNNYFNFYKGYEKIIIKAMIVYCRVEEIKSHEKYNSFEKKIKEFKKAKGKQNQEYNEIIYLIFPELYPTSSS